MASGKKAVGKGRTRDCTTSRTINASPPARRGPSTRDIPAYYNCNQDRDFTVSDNMLGIRASINCRGPVDKSDETEEAARGSRDQVLFTRIGDTSPSHELMLEQAARLARLGYFVFNMDEGIVEVCSERHASIFGRTPDEFISLVTGLKGKMGMMHPDDVNEVRIAYERLRNGEAIEIEYRFYNKDGSLGYIREFVAPERNAEGRVVRGLGSSMDVTESRVLEQKRAHASRLGALGELTAGVAHDFNNLLAVVLGNAELAEAVTTQSERNRCLREIVDAARRGGSLTRSLLSFAQRAAISPGPAEISEESLKAVDTFRRTSLKKVSVILNAHPEPLVANVDRDQLQSVLINLLLNAKDAVEVGGEIEVSTYPAEPTDVRRLVTEYHLREDNYCTIEVSDGGCGIKPALLPRVTEPFFTTKSRADGSGLGLSMAIGFARQANGALEIQSDEGVGTAVKIHFPLIEELPERATRSDGQDYAFVDRCLLLLEDDPAVAKMLSTQLELIGFRVTAVDKAAQAIAAIHRCNFNVAVLDNVISGGLSGIEVAEQLKAKDHDIKTILLTGYLDQDLEEGLPFLDRVLRKPAPFSVLLENISQLLKSTHQVGPD